MFTSESNDANSARQAVVGGTQSSNRSKKRGDWNELKPFEATTRESFDATSEV